MCTVNDICGMTDEVYRKVKHWRYMYIFQQPGFNYTG